MMFETVTIFKPNNIDQANYDINLFKRVIQKYSKEKEVNVEVLGLKELAYEVEGYSKGYYAVFTYQATYDDVIDLEHKLKVNGNVMKFITVKTDVPEIRENKPKRKHPVDVFDLIFGIGDQI